MEQGRVIAVGTHDALVRDNALYARLAALQFGAAPPVDDHEPVRAASGL
jgi:hypothetical protein